ncbi:hypothetical protein WA026_000808 [Henosepilachna vigintioctopunctata]|uniref:Uncharacterized protein n=1 Tax=Henosepilachna vigintioctopunctata TaxID=420089 RepID=A0AAW1V737_9CUCU
MWVLTNIQYLSSVSTNKIKMYEIYAVIGVALIITGVTSCIYFTLQIKKKKLRKCFVERLSDGLGTVFLGIFYIYCYSVLNENMENFSTTIHFPDMEETYLNVSNEESINSDIFTTLTSTDSKVSVASTSSIHEIFKETDKNKVEVGNESSTTELLTSDVISSTSLNENEADIINTYTTDFPYVEKFKNNSLNLYQNYFKDILKLKSANDSRFENLTIFFNNTEYKGSKNRIKFRTRRDSTKIAGQISININEQCFTKLFIKHALLIGSFLYSIICLINNTKLCYNNGTEKKVDQEELTQEDKTKLPEENEEIPKESGSSGKFFTENCTKGENRTEAKACDGSGEPNLDIFLAQSYRTSDLPEKTAIESRKRLNSFQFQKILPPVSKFLVIWLLPGLCIYSLHMMIEREDVSNSTVTPNLQYNLNTTRVNNEMLELLNSPLNVTTRDKTEEINSVVKNIYNIIGKSSQQSKSENGLMKKHILYDITDFLNGKFRKTGENNKENCFFNTITLKIHSSLLFFIMYFASIFYSKILHIKMKQEENEYTHLIRLYIYMFSIMWFPGISELFSRIYIFNEKSSTAADCTLSFGNLFILFTNLNNYLLNKNVRIRVNTKV